MPDFLPRREADLLDWTRNFSHTISAAPEAFALTAEQAAAYAAIQQDFSATYQRSQDPATRGGAAVLAKDEALKALKQETRALASIVRARLGRDGARLVPLGMKAASRNRRPRSFSVSAPRLILKPTTRREVTLWIEDRDRTGKAKPAGVDRATVVLYVGEALPRDMQDWTYAFSTTQTRVTAALPKGLAPGTYVWYAAWWESPTGKRSQASEPVSTRVGFCEAPRFAKRAA